MAFNFHGPMTNTNVGNGTNKIINNYGSSHSHEQNFDDIDCLTLLEEKEDQSKNVYAAAVDESFMWKKGQQVFVYFMDGDLNLQNEVMGIAETWNPYSLITFSRCSNLDGSHIRVTFSGRGCSSVLGTSCLDTKLKGKPTMTLAGVVNASSAIKTRHVLHEFGHALGLVHEHQNPDKNIPWDHPKVYEYYRKKQHWSIETVYHNILKPKKCSNYSQFDPFSIMLYPIRKELLDPHGEHYQYFANVADSLHTNCALSEHDKKFFANYYNQLESEGSA